MSPEAAAYVDRHVAPVAHKLRPARLERLVSEAVVALGDDPVAHLEHGNALVSVDQQVALRAGDT